MARLTQQRRLFMFSQAVLFCGVASASEHNRCEAVVELAQQASDLSQFIQRIAQDDIPSMELRGCETHFRRSSAVTQLLAQRRRELFISRRPVTDRSISEAQDPLSYSINRRIAQLIRASENHYREQLAHHNRGTDAVTSTLGDASAAIETIYPNTLAPGVVVTLRGRGFTLQEGQVTIRHGNKHAVLDTEHWSDRWIAARIPTTLAGYFVGDRVTLEIQLANGRRLRRKVGLIPLYRQQRVVETFRYASDGMTPSQGYATIFRGERLQRGWQVADIDIQSPPTLGHCYLGTPSMTIGEQRLESQLRWSVDWFESYAVCEVEVTLQGPQGTPSGL